MEFSRRRVINLDYHMDHTNHMIWYTISYVWTISYFLESRFGTINTDHFYDAYHMDPDIDPMIWKICHGLYHIVYYILYIWYEPCDMDHMIWSISYTISYRPHYMDHTIFNMRTLVRLAKFIKGKNVICYHGTKYTSLI